MKLFTLLAIIIPCICQAQTNPFVPIDYEYPEELLTNPKTYIYKNNATGEFRFKDISLERKGQDIVITEKEYDSTTVADSSIDINNKAFEHYVIMNGKRIKGTILQDSTHKNGSKLGLKLQAVSFKVSPEMTWSANIHSRYLKDTTVDWEGKRGPCIAIYSESDHAIKDNQDKTVNQMESKNVYYFGKGVGLLQFRTTNKGETSLWQLIEIKRKTPTSKSSMSEAELYNLISYDVCSCLENKARTKLKHEDYEPCVSQAMQVNMEILRRDVLSRFPDSLSYKMGYEWGKKVGYTIDTGLVYSCDVYFALADTLRMSVYNVFNKDSLKQNLLKIEGTNNKKDLNFLVESGRTNFLLGNFKEALTSAEEILKVQPSIIVALLIKAYCLEMDKKFEDAALCFYQLDKLTGEHAYLVSAAINNRKRKEQLN